MLFSSHPAAEAGAAAAMLKPAARTKHCTSDTTRPNAPDIFVFSRDRPVGFTTAFWPPRQLDHSFAAGLTRDATGAAASFTARIGMASLRPCFVLPGGRVPNPERWRSNR